MRPKPLHSDYGAPRPAGMQYGRRPPKPVLERPSRQTYGDRRSVEPQVDDRPLGDEPSDESDQSTSDQVHAPEKRSHATGILIVLMVIGVLLFQHFFPLDTPCQKNPAAYGKLIAYDCLRDKNPQRLDGRAPD